MVSIAPEFDAERARLNRWPADVKWGIAIIVLFVLHIVLIFTQCCPFWGICFPFTPIAPQVWPLVAIGLALWIVTRALTVRFRPQWRVRSITAILLTLLATDTLSGGDYRWFELAMRHQIAEVGGPAALQTWAQGCLSSPEKVAVFDAAGDGPVDAKQVPPAFQHFFGRVHPLYRMSTDGGPAFQFDDGGWDMGWGVIVGRTDLANGWPRGLGGGRGWIKQIQPGVFIYAFQ